MVDNQHKLIAGYRDLTQADIDLMNEWKRIELLLDTQLSQIEVRGTAQARWNAMARTHLETGVMYAIKAIAYPHGGLGNPPSEEERQRQQAVQPYPKDYPQPAPAPARDLEHERTQALAQQTALDEDEAQAKDRERRVHEDRQRHGFDPYATKTPPKRQARPAGDDDDEEADSIEREEIARELEAEEAAEELRSIENEEIRRELDAEEEGLQT